MAEKPIDQEESTQTHGPHIVRLRLTAQSNADWSFSRPVSAVAGTSLKNTNVVEITWEPWRDDPQPPLPKVHELEVALTAPNSAITEVYQIYAQNYWTFQDSNELEPPRVNLTHGQWPAYYNAVGFGDGDRRDISVHVAADRILDFKQNDGLYYDNNFGWRSDIGGSGAQLVMFETLPQNGKLEIQVRPEPALDAWLEIDLNSPYLASGDGHAGLKSGLESLVSEQVEGQESDWAKILAGNSPAYVALPFDLERFEGEISQLFNEQVIKLCHPDDGPFTLCGRIRYTPDDPENVFDEFDYSILQIDTSDAHVDMANLLEDRNVPPNYFRKSNIGTVKIRDGAGAIVRPIEPERPEAVNQNISSGVGQFEPGYGVRPDTADTRVRIPTGAAGDLLYTARPYEGDSVPLLAVKTAFNDEINGGLAATPTDDFDIRLYVKGAETGNSYVQTASFPFQSPGTILGLEEIEFFIPFDVGAFSSGQYNYKVEVVHNNVVNSSVTVTDPLLIVKDDDIGFGPGYTIEGIDRLLLPPNDATTKDVYWLRDDGNYFKFDDGEGKADGDTTGSELLANGTLRDKFGNVSTYDAMGNLATRTDSSGNTASFTFSTDGFLEEVNLLPENHKTTYERNNLDQIVEQQDFTRALSYPVEPEDKGRLTNFGYNNGRLVSVTYPDPDYNGESRGSTTISYPPGYSGRVNYSIVDADGVWNLFTFGGQGDSVKDFYHSAVDNFTLATRERTQYSGFRLPLSNVENTRVFRHTIDHADPTKDNRIGRSIDELNRTVDYEANEVGHILETRTSAGAQSIVDTYARNDAGQATSHTSPETRHGRLTTSYGYTDDYSLESIGYPDGAMKTWEYDLDFGIPTAFVDEVGDRTEYELNPTTGKVETVTLVMDDVADIVSSYTYTAASGQYTSGID